MDHAGAVSKRYRNRASWRREKGEGQTAVCAGWEVGEKWRGGGRRGRVRLAGAVSKRGTCERDGAKERKEGGRRRRWCRQHPYG